jgi:hypothetical protein
MSVEERTARSLNKEYEMLKKYATRPDAPKGEQDYYHNMASHVASRIDWNLLKPKAKKDTDVSPDDYSFYSDKISRFNKSHHS